MKHLAILAGRHAALGQLVRARLAAALAGRVALSLHCAGDALDAADSAALRALDVAILPTGPAPGEPAADCVIVLDQGALPGATGRARVVEWSLLAAAFGQPAASPEDGLARLAAADGNLGPRIAVLLGLLDMPAGPPAAEFHASIRVHDLARSVRFYAWLLDTWPREWTHRYATFVRPDLALTFVLLVADGRELHHDTLYHVGIGVADQAAVVDAYHRAVAFGARIGKPPRTTWRGTPLHELWLEDPDGTLIEIYARLTPDELARMPPDQEPTFLVPGTAG